MSVEMLITKLPKVELHLHIEGTLEPDLMWALAQKHNITLPYSSVSDIAAAYKFDSLQSFLDLYYQGANVLRDEDDFYQLTWAYMLRCKQDNIVHTEIMFDPQTHTQRGIDFSVFMKGITKALKQAQDELEISSCLIMSFLRHLSEQSAIDTLLAAKPYYEQITAVGLDSSELGNPPEKFTKVFKQAKELGFKAVAHAGEEGPPTYIWQALSMLNVDRIDHGVRACEDNKLMAYLRHQNIALTVCPMSNLKLCVVEDMSQHNILALLNEDLMVTVNSDDPSYFGAYLNDNYMALYEHLNMSAEQCIRLVKNSVLASFMSDENKQKQLIQIDEIVASN